MKSPEISMAYTPLSGFHPYTMGSSHFPAGSRCHQSGAISSPLNRFAAGIVVEASPCLGALAGALALFVHACHDLLQ